MQSLIIMMILGGLVGIMVIVVLAVGTFALFFGASVLWCRIEKVYEKSRGG